MKIAILDRLISVITYFTFGMFGLVWLIFSHVTGKKNTQFLMFNIVQAFFISILLYAFSIIYDIAIGFISMVPFIGKYALAFNTFFVNTPMYFSFTLSALIITVFITYLSLLALLGKRSYIPFVSDIVQSNFGG